MTMREQRRTAKIGGTAAVALVAAATPAAAGGLIVPGYGSQAQPRAGAFVAKADDPTALYYNPAGLAGQRGTAIHVGFNLLDFDQRFQRTGFYEPGQATPGEFAGDPYPEVTESSTPGLGVGGFQAVPTILVTTDLGGRLPFVLGAGLIAEHAYADRDYGVHGSGYTAEDPTRPPPPQRYDVISTQVVAAFPSLAAGYAIGKLDVGARVSWGFSSIKGTTYVWAIENYEEDVGKDGEISIDVADRFVPAAQLGLRYRATPAWELGLQWTSARSIHAKGTGQAPLGSGVSVLGQQAYIEPVTGDAALCEDGGTLTRLKVCVDTALPQTATLGARYVLRDGAGRERGDVEVDVQWEDWSNATDTGILFDGADNSSGRPVEQTYSRHGFRDAFSFRLGGAYGVPLGGPLAGGELAVRAGVGQDTAAAPTSWTRLETDGMARTTLGVGVGLTVGGTRIDLGGGYVHEGALTVKNACNPDPPDTLGCGAGDVRRPQSERDAPDPLQPIRGPNDQLESPYNAGTYRQGYVLLSLGATHAF